MTGQRGHGGAQTLPVRTAFRRYVLTGCALLLGDLALFLSLTHAGIAPAVAQAASRGAGAIFGFIAHKRYSFRHGGMDERGLLSQGSGYGALTLAGVALSPFILALALRLCGERLLVAKLAAEVVLAGLNFIAMRWLFRSQPRSAATP
ncbi:putative flippase GtrA [Cupriavidus alkaliphilus]|nr:putative flippase GtrA [Cupriavidus alkaliphilus]